MKRTALFTMISLLLLLGSCSGKKQEPAVKAGFDETGKILAGKDIITEIYLYPDTLGDPWEVEKVAGYDGEKMFRELTGKIYSGEITVYDPITGEKLKAENIRAMESEFGFFGNSAGKMIFTEDWYFNPSTGNIEKRIKSVAFGYEQKREGGLPSAWRPLFMIKAY